MAKTNRGTAMPAGQRPGVYMELMSLCQTTPPLLQLSFVQFIRVPARMTEQFKTPSQN